MKFLSAFKSFFESFVPFATICSLVAVPWILSVQAGKYNRAIADQNNSVQMIQIAVGILNNHPIEGDIKSRQWAIQIINKYSEIPIDDSLKRQLEMKSLRSLYKKMGLDSVPDYWVWNQLGNPNPPPNSPPPGR